MATRRRNKSNKVPNVKLRPADPSALASSRARLVRDVVSTSWALDSDGDGDTSIADTCPRPLKDVVLCATGKMDKASIFEKAFRLGAMTVTDFTDKVTHLLAVDHGSAKYQCAVELKIPIMQPSWIEECHDVWLRGDDVDVELSVEEHRLPAFTGIIMSLSGIEDPKRKMQIQKLLESQGGTYAKDLQRPVRVTHVLCAGDEETEKMRYARRFNERKEAQIQLVWEQWFWDCLEFGGRFPERDYDVSKPAPLPRQPPSPPPSRSSEAPPDTSPPGSSSPSRPVSPHEKPEDDQDNEDERVISVRRPARDTLRVWASVLGSRGFVMEGSKLMRSPTKRPPENVTRGDPSSPLGRKQIAPIEDLGDDTNKGAARSMLSSFSRVNSFAPASADVSGPQRAWKRAATHTAVNENEGDSSFFGDMRSKSEGNMGVGSSKLRPQYFAGRKIMALGEARSPAVQDAVEQAGGKLVAEGSAETDEVDWIVVRLVSGSSIFRSEDDPSAKAKYRTECWLEWCVHESRVCEPDEHPSFVPLAVDTPIPGAENVVLSFSGLEISETIALKRLIRALGITLAPNFSRRSTHLLCPSGKGAKYEKALEWRIPVVHNGWLAKIVKIGSIPTAFDFLVGASVTDFPSFLASQTPETAHPKPKTADNVNNTTNGFSASANKNRKHHTKDGGSEAWSEMAGFGQRLDLLRTTPERESHRSSPDTDIEQERKSQFEVESNENLLTQPPGSNPLDGGIPPPTAESEPGSIPLASTKSLPVLPSSSAPHASALASVSSSSTSALFDPPPVVQSKPRMVGTPSPDKVNVEAARALQESINNLIILGKRGSVDTMEDGTGVSGTGGRRPGKRARPLAKTRSKQDSPFDPTTGTHAQAEPLPRLAPPSYEPYEGLNTSVLAADKEADTGMLVTYEDPGERDEKRRLLSLFGGLPSVEEDAPANAGKGRKKPAKKVSQRKPGF